VNFFDAATGAKLRKFEGSIDDYAVGAAAGADGALKWPIFKWAAHSCALFPSPLARAFCPSTLRRVLPLLHAPSVPLMPCFSSSVNCCPGEVSWWVHHPPSCWVEQGLRPPRSPSSSPGKQRVWGKICPASWRGLS
jgi:hypothetical protein